MADQTQPDGPYPFENLKNDLYNEIQRAGLGEDFPAGSDLRNVVWALAESSLILLYLKQFPDLPVSLVLPGAVELAEQLVARMKAFNVDQEKRVIYLKTIVDD